MATHIYVHCGKTRDEDFNTPTKDSPHENPVMRNEIKGRGKEFVEEMEALGTRYNSKTAKVTSQVSKLEAEARQLYKEGTQEALDWLMTERAKLRAKYPMKSQ